MRDGKTQAELYRQIPNVDDLLGRPHLKELAGKFGRALVLQTAREVLETIRSLIPRDAEKAANLLQPEKLEETIMEQVRQALAPSLRPVINATGVILHTNLGRAPLMASALRHLEATAGQYSNLEYDLAARARGKRDVHTAARLASLLGAEAAIVVNNCAAAVLLVLHTLARDGEVIVSRGELIEIGDGFRIPEIMAASGATLREVGTTNRTRLADYEQALSERTRLLLRVHPSNFRVVGFTERPSLEELVDLARRRGLPLFEDLGSGCLADLTAQGLREPEAKRSIEAGADLVAFSGDKLLGGPQAGIIAGKRELVNRARRNPLFRALRVDKLTIAVLEATLGAYLRGAWDEIPVLRMIRAKVEEIERRSRNLISRLQAAVPPGAAEIELRPGNSVIGGGSTPDQCLPTVLISISSPIRSAEQLTQALHAQPVPVIARVESDRLLLDLRTVYEEQEEPLLTALLHVLRTA